MEEKKRTPGINITEHFERNLKAEMEFAVTYKKYKDEHISIREARCLETMFKEYFADIQEGDLFAGRIKYPLLGFGLETTTGGTFYFSKKNRIINILNSLGFDEDFKTKMHEAIEFWRDEEFLDTDSWGEEIALRSKMLQRLPKDVLAATSNPIASMGGRLAGSFINYEKLMKIGLSGLLEEVTDYRNKCKDNKLYEGMLIALQTLKDVCKRYSVQAQKQAETVKDVALKIELLEMAKTLERITAAKPSTLREGIQLMWIYTLAAEVVNYGRMDIYLGDLYVSDLERGILTETKALELLQSLWRLIVSRKTSAEESNEFNGRVVIGGTGRPNETNADKFCILAMEASRTVIEPEPQLTLRFYSGMNPVLMKKALDVIGEGRVYPMLYNDDINTPAVQRAFNSTFCEAEQYVPLGCGEYVLDHISIGSPNCSLNMLKALEVALHNGREALSHEVFSLQTGEVESFDTFEKLYAAYAKQVEYHVEMLARRHAIEYEVESEMASCLFVSMLYDDCLSRGKSVVGGGARYKGGIIESFGMVNAADSLTAIKEIVYDRKLMSLTELVKILDANFEGYKDVQQLCLSAPKFGNDLAAADNMLKKVSDHVCKANMDQAARLGLDYFLVVNINNQMNVTLGKVTAASAEGRLYEAPLANGNTPTAGMDRNGITAFLNSLAKIGAEGHAGYSQNMKFSKQMFNKEREKFEVLLDTYFKKGGAQAMITAVNRGDLENAMKEQEKYGNLIIRVGGFSARFTELTRDVQIDVLNRTLY